MKKRIVQKVQVGPWRGSSKKKIYDKKGRKNGEGPKDPGPKFTDSNA